MNKKALMVKSLVTIVLAIIIFVPVITCSVKYCQFSAQAGNNFVEFVGDINRMEDWQDGITKVILDEETAVVYFEPGEEIVKVNVDSGLIHYGHRIEYDVFFNKPPSCKGEKGCLCLFRETETDDLTVTSEGASCKEIDFNLKLNPFALLGFEVSKCGIGEAKLVESYICTGGFVIERLLIKKASDRYDVFYNAPRRIALEMKKEGNDLILTS